MSDAPARAPNTEADTALGRVDGALASSLFAGYLGLLLGTAKSLGYARDEGFYFRAAESYAGWFSLLLRAPHEALRQKAVDAAWGINPEHPPLLKSLFGLSHWLLFQTFGVFSEPGTSFRFPGMVLSAAGVALLYLWGKEAISRRAGVFAALAYGFVPTTFYHAHLDCFDAPIATLWLLVAYTYWQSLHGAPKRRSTWAIATGLAFGLAFASKHNSWFLPIAFVVHTLAARPRGLLDDLRRDAVSLPKALVWMALLGPLVLVATWPLLWWNGAARFAFYVRFHLQHEYYNMEYLGRTYFAPPMPLGYAWTMTAATVPTVTLLATVAGLVRALAGLFDGDRWPRDDARTRDTTRLWLIALLVNYLAWFSPQTPIFGGTKHWLTAYPFLCLFAARGFEACAATLEKALSPDAHASVHSSSARVVLGHRWLSVTLLGAVLAAPVVESLRAHPWGLSAYTPLVGGAPGAADLGLNRGFWGYQTGAVLDVLNELPRHATIYLHDTTYESFQMLQRDGRLRGDLRATWSPAQADAALYHHEQHMAGVEQQIWVTMGTVAPRVVRGLDGVPIVWVYVRGR